MKSHRDAMHLDMWRKVKRPLRGYVNLSDEQEKAVVVVIEQAQRLRKDLARVS